MDWLLDTRAGNMCNSGGGNIPARGAPLASEEVDIE